MSIKIDYTSIPDKTPEEMEKFYPVNTIFTIEEIFTSDRTFKIILQDFIDIMKMGFEIENVRKRPVIYRFKRTDKKNHMMSMANFISSLIIWKPLLDTDNASLLDESWIFDFSKFNSKSLSQYANTKLLPAIDDVDFASKNVLIEEMHHNIVCISRSFCMLMGLSLSLYDIYQLEKRYPEISDLIRNPIDEKLQPHEMEEETAERTKRLLELIVTDTEMNDYKPFFASGTALKTNQFGEFIVKIGFKADLNGNTIPIFINNNFLLDGLNKPSYLYINALSGRKAMILSKLAMSAPGAASKKIVMNSLTSKLRTDYEMCNSIMTTDYLIKDDALLLYLNGRYYYDEEGDMQLLNYDTDKHLIGKIIRFRGPNTCNSKEGVCKYCYGHLFETNMSMASAGALAGLKLTEPIGQSVLSAKHSQNTSSNNINLSEGFDELFDIDGSLITTKDDSDMESDLYIRLNDINIEEMDDSILYYVTSFDVLDSDNKNIHRITDDQGAKFYLNDRLVQLCRGKLVHRGVSPIVALEDIEEDDTLFTIEVKNKELTEPLKVVMQIINTDDHCGANTISEICQLFAEKLMAIGIRYELVHMEMVLKALLRKKSNILEYPDFSLGGDLNDYVILKLNDSHLYNPSALVSLPFGYLRKQLLSTELYNKTATGPLDALYVSNLSEVI